MSAARCCSTAWSAKSARRVRAIDGYRQYLQAGLGNKSDPAAAGTCTVAPSPSRPRTTPGQPRQLTARRSTPRPASRALAAAAAARRAATLGTAGKPTNCRPPPPLLRGWPAVSKPKNANASCKRYGSMRYLMRVVAWHNRHPLARRINASQVHSIGEVVLPVFQRPATGRRRLPSDRPCRRPPSCSIHPPPGSIGDPNADRQGRAGRRCIDRACAGRCRAGRRECPARSASGRRRAPAIAAKPGPAGCCW